MRVRTVGVALIGLVAMETIARIAVAGGARIFDSPQLALFLGLLAPALAVAGTIRPHHRRQDAAPLGPANGLLRCYLAQTATTAHASSQEGLE